MIGNTGQEPLMSNGFNKTKIGSIGGTPKLEKKRGTSQARVIEKEMVLPPNMKGVAEDGSHEHQRIGNLLQ